MGNDTSATRKKSEKTGNALIKSLTDSTDFKAFIKANIGNEEFKKFGQAQGMDAVRGLWYKKRAQTELKTVHEIDRYDAIDAVRDAIPQSVLDGWFRDANSDYKPKLAEAIFSNPGTLNAGLNIAYANYKDAATGTPMSFDKWLWTSQTMYRGEYGQTKVKSDIFTSYTPNKKVAESFGASVTAKKIKPVDTWGSYQTTAEQEFLIPLN